MQREVQRALETFDTDGDGQISFDEFLIMAMSSHHFKFKVRAAACRKSAYQIVQVQAPMRVEVLTLAGVDVEACWYLTDPSISPSVSEHWLVSWWV